MIQLLRWFMLLTLAALAGRLISKIKLPAILGWLIIGMLSGPHALNLMSQPVLDVVWYKTDYCPIPASLSFLPESPVRLWPRSRSLQASCWERLRRRL